MSSSSVKSTQFAQQGLDFATLFSAKFARSVISGYRPILREPEETTAGGKQAIQHIVFEPQIQDDPMLAVGYVNVVTKTAKLRTFDCVAELFQMRFPKRVFTVDQRQYQQWFDKVAEFLRRQGMQIQIETHPPMRKSSRPPPGAVAVTGANLILWLLIVVVIAGGIIGVALRLTGRL